jgi:FtsH-binding integral membrane protein
MDTQLKILLTQLLIIPLSVSILSIVALFTRHDFSLTSKYLTAIQIIVIALVHSIWSLIRIWTM